MRKLEVGKVPRPDWTSVAGDLAESHVEWFLGIIRPLLQEHFVHGFKHGLEYKEKEEERRS